MESNTPPTKQVQEQLVLFAADRLLSESLPLLADLRPAQNLLSIFDDCHNYIYANEGMLKEKIFHEMVKLLMLKLYDEQKHTDGLQFGITASEYRQRAALPAEFLHRLGCLFEQVCRSYPALFSDESLKLKPQTLAYVVEKLQLISLSQTPGDVKGEAFQSFTYRHQRGDRGEFFTPHPIVRLAVMMMSPRPEERVVDPACGSGGFLLQAIQYVRQCYADASLSAYVRNNVAGIEFNPDVALSATLRLAFEGGTGTEILCANALSEHSDLDNTFDIVLTNPPFGNKGKVEDPQILKLYQLARRWTKTQAGWNITSAMLSGQSPDILFIEKCLRLLRPGGRMAVVLPDGLLQNISSGYVRHWLRTQARVLGVVSIPQEAFVPYGTGIKTSLLLLQKFPAAAEHPCFMARIHKMGYDVKGQPVYRTDAAGRLLRNAAGLPVVDDDLGAIATAFLALQTAGSLPQAETIYTVPQEQLNSRLDVEHYLPDDQSLLEKLRAAGARPLGELAEIVAGSDDFRLTADADIRYIAISDVDARTMQVVSQQTIKAHEAPSRATYRLRTGDIITATSGASTGTARQATALITEDEDDAICSNGFAVIRNVRGIEPLFLLAYLRTEPCLRQVRRLMTGHAIPAISTDDLAKVLIPVLPWEDQKRIAAWVASIQAARKEALRMGERMIDELNAQFL
jgi:type I restriction enzyme M protein